MMERSTIQKIPKESLDDCPIVLTLDNLERKKWGCFEDMVPSTQRMKKSLMFSLWSWATTNPNVQVVNVIDFLDVLDLLVTI